MTGLIVLAIAVPLLLAYLWLARAAVRYAKRKTGSNFVAALAVVGIFVVTFGDTLFNRWYHKEVLCKREDAGVRIFEKIQLPAEYLDEKTLRPRFPLPLDQPFFSHFSPMELRTNSGFFPLTAHGRIERTIVDNESGKVLARFVDYWPAGGPWWGAPIAWFGESSLIGWLYSRQHMPTCFDDGTQNALLAISSYFYAIHQGELK
jgi:hypothetical protein